MTVWRLFVGRLLAIVFVVAGCCWGQQKDAKAEDQTTTETTVQKIRDLPAEWLIGPYIPSGLPLQPLTNQQRKQVYFNQTFFSAQAYLARLFVAGIDQARGTPSQWGGGMLGYGQRFGSRYGSFVIASTFHSVGNAALGYESRYDFCKCKGLERRSLHAIVRNFVTYNRTERERRPAIPLYVGSFGAGMISSTWLPGRRNVWRDGAYGALVQAGYGSAINWFSEFSLDILRKITSDRYPREIRIKPIRR
jgi:hypothetical protein